MQKVSSVLPHSDMPENIEQINSKEINIVPDSDP